MGPPVLRRRAGSKPRQGLCIGQIVNGRHRAPAIRHHCACRHCHCASSSGWHQLGRKFRIRWARIYERYYRQFHAHIRSRRCDWTPIHVHRTGYRTEEQGVVSLPLVTDNPFSLAGSQVENDSLGRV